MSKEEPKLKNFRENINEKFLQQRRIFLWGAVSDKSAEETVEKLLYLEYLDPNKPIYFFINSPGGVISAGMAVYDVMKAISSPVYTVTMGMAASMGSILACSGRKGHRYILKHAKMMIHQPLISGQIIAPAIDIKIRAEEIKKTKEEMNRILAEATGQTLKKIEQDTDRDYYMNAKESIAYGLVDTQISNLNDASFATKGTPKVKGVGGKRVRKPAPKDKKSIQR